MLWDMLPARTKNNRLEHCQNTGANLLSFLGGSKLRRYKFHKNFEQTRLPNLAMDALPFPHVHSEIHGIKILILPVLFGYLVLGSDLYTASSYYQSGHPVWSGLGLFFALGPAIDCGIRLFSTRLQLVSSCFCSDPADLAIRSFGYHGKRGIQVNRHGVQRHPRVSSYCYLRCIYTYPRRSRMQRRRVPS